MRKWNVAELDAILVDLAFIEGIKLAEGQDDPLDYEWLSERIETRDLHGARVIERCDGCWESDRITVTVVVTEYHDSMGAPSNLGVAYVCNRHIRDTY